VKECDRDVIVVKNKGISEKNQEKICSKAESVEV